MLGVKILYSLVLTSFCWCIVLGVKSCDEAILAKLSEGPANGIKQDNFIQSSGAPNDTLALGIPFVGGTDAWELRYGGNEASFTSPLFVLDEMKMKRYWITAVEIQNGYEAGSMCGSLMTSQNNFIKKIKLTVGIDSKTSEFASIHAPYAAQTDDKGEPVINLQQLGFKGQGRSIRITFPPIQARVVNLNVIEFLQPEDPTVAQSVCLRAEIYGCKVGPGNEDTPDINMGPLLQYIMPYPDALIDGYMHLDTGYTGSKSFGLLSGGDGLLTDGSLGETPLINPEQYLGWSVCATKNPYIIFLFNNEYPVTDFIARLWDYDNSRVVEYSDFKIFDQFDNEVQFDRMTVFNVSYVKIVFSYPTNSMVLLLSEVSFSNASNFNVVTGSNLTDLLLAKYQSVSSATTPMSTNSTTSTTSTSVASTTYSGAMSSLNATSGTEPTVNPAGREQFEQNTILYIVIGVLAFLVVLLILIVVLQGTMLICYSRSRERSTSEAQFYPEGQDDNVSGGNNTPMDTIKSNDARVTEKPTDLSESQVYL